MVFKTHFFLTFLFFTIFLVTQKACLGYTKQDERAVLLALFKNVILDNKEIKTKEDLNNELENLRNCELYPNEFDKFEKFIDAFFEYFFITKVCRDVKQLLYLSGIFNDLYIDVETLDEEFLKKYFKIIENKGLGLINFLLNNNLLTPPNDKNLDGKQDCLPTNKYIEYITRFNQFHNLKNKNLEGIPFSEIIINFYANNIIIPSHGSGNALFLDEHLNQALKKHELKNKVEDKKFFNEVDDENTDDNANLFKKKENENLFPFKQNYKNKFTHVLYENQGDDLQEKDNNSCDFLNKNIKDTVNKLINYLGKWLRLNQKNENVNTKEDDNNEHIDGGGFFLNTLKDTTENPEFYNKNEQDRLILSNNAIQNIKREIKNNKMKLKEDEEVDNPLKKKNGNMNISIGQKGLGNLTEFFNFKKNSTEKNIQILNDISKNLNGLNILDTILFTQKLTENICASYCVNISGVLEIQNFDMFLYKKIDIFYTPDSVHIKDKNIEIGLDDFLKILNILNINGQTIALNCPCKYYTHRNITYDLHFTKPFGIYFTRIKEFDCTTNFDPTKILFHLNKFQEDLEGLRNGKRIAKLNEEVTTPETYFKSAHYHNNLYYNDDIEDIDSDSNEAYKDPVVIEKIDFKFPDADTIDLFYNGSPVNLSNMDDVIKVLNEEMAIKIDHINSYKFGEHVFKTYTNFGKDDEELKFSRFRPTLRSSLNNLNKNLKDELDGEKLMKDIYGYKKNHKVLLNNETKVNEKVPVNTNKDDGHFNLKNTLDLNKLKENANKKYNLLNQTNYNNFNKFKVNETDVTKDRENTLKLDTKDTNTQLNEDLPFKEINVKYLFYYFKNLLLWDVDRYCNNIFTIEKILKVIRLTDNIIFEEDLDNNKVIFYFAKNNNTKYAVPFDFYLFLLDKLTTVAFLDDLCSIYNGLNRVNPELGRLRDYLNNEKSALNYLVTSIFEVKEEFEKKKNYVEKLSDISTSGLFFIRKNVDFDLLLSNHISFDEKDIHKLSIVYMDDLSLRTPNLDIRELPYHYIANTVENTTNDTKSLKLVHNTNITDITMDSLTYYLYHDNKKIMKTLLENSKYILHFLNPVPKTLKVYTLVVYNDNPLMANVILKTTINFFNLSFLQSILEFLLDIPNNEQFFIYNGRYMPKNSFIILTDCINHIFLNFVPNVGLQ